jgi:hypothetical protein
MVTLLKNIGFMIVLPETDRPQVVRVTTIGSVSGPYHGWQIRKTV